MAVAVVMVVGGGGGEGGEDQAASRGHAGSGQSAHQPSKRELSNQQLGRSLVLADLSQRHSPRSARARQGLLTGRRSGAAWAGQAYRKRCGLRILAAGAAAPDGAPATCTGTASEACARRCAQNWRRTCQSASEQGLRVGADQLQRPERQQRLRCAALARRRGACGAASELDDCSALSRESPSMAEKSVSFYFGGGKREPFL